MTVTLGLVDYGMGNRRSMQKSLERAGATVVMTGDHDALRATDGLVVPGVGAFARAMDGCWTRPGLDRARPRARGAPASRCSARAWACSCCSSSSPEFGGADGLGLLPGEVVPLDARGLKLPHIGWNSVRWARPSALSDGLPDPAPFYHVHSFVPGIALDSEIALGISDYGSEFASRRRPRERVRHPVPSREVLARRDRPAGELRAGLHVCGGDSSLILYPAIDISEGKAVRLVKGDFNQVTVYEDSPLEAARAWVDAGARFLHVVDLDGARTGSPKSLEHLEQITTELHVPVQYGGGLRSLPAVRDALRAGAERVILGTAAFNDIDFLDDVLGAFRERTIVSVDTRGGNVSTSGWQETTQMPAEAVIERLQNRGVRSFVYTDVDRDGMLGGINFEAVKRIAQVVRGRFIYSGGIGSLDDLRGLRDLRQVNLGGVIAGKALYEGRFTIAEGQQALQPEPVEGKKPYRAVPAAE